MLPNIDGLSGLTSVEGWLKISYNAALTNVDGLSGLTDLGGDLSIFFNPALTNINGLSALTSVGGYLELVHNATLTNMDGFSALTSVGGYLELIFNAALTNVDGFSALTSVGGDLTISEHSVLWEFCGLYPMLNGGGLNGTYTVSDNAANPTEQEIIDGGPCPVVCPGDITLSSQSEVNAFDCTSVEGNLTISGDDISDLSPLTNLTDLGGYLSIYSNAALTNVDGFSALISVGGDLAISENSALSEFCGLYTLFNVGGLNGTYTVSGNAANPTEQEIVDAGPCQDCDGDITLSSQGQVDAFDCTTVVGNLTISGADITDLNQLTGLIIVGGSLIIIDNPLLENIDGLSSLTSVGGGENSRNPALPFVEQMLNIEQNPLLTNVNGLSSLTSVVGNLTFWYNSMLVEYCGLYPLISGGGLTGSYSVGYNGLNPSTAEIFYGGPCTVVCPGDITLSSQAEVNAFDCTSVEGNLTISGDDISDLSPLSVLTNVGGNLYIGNNVVLQNLDGLSALSSVSGYFHIYFNDALTSIEGLSALTSVGGNLDIYENNLLTNVNGLSALTYVGGKLWLNYCNALANIDGLTAITSLDGDISIDHNNALMNIDGLSGLTTVNGILWLNNCNALMNLDGLIDLTFIGGDAKIYNNDVMTNIDGLTSLMTIGGNLQVTNNPSLSEFCGLYPLLNGGGLNGTYTVTGNSLNPTKEEIIATGLCGSYVINLSAGWQGLSSYIMPAENDIVEVINPVAADFIIATTMTDIYYPAGPINTIIDWASQSAYKVKMSVPATLPMFGDEETNKTIALPAGWSLMPVICNYPVDAATTLAPFDLEIAKDVAGTGVLWEDMGINTLGNLEPGSAYYVLLNASGSITFPANSAKGAVIEATMGQMPENPWNEIHISSSSHLLAVIAGGMEDVLPGDVIGVFSTDGFCYGISEVINPDQNMAISVFADDQTTTYKDGFEVGESFTLKLFNPDSSDEFDLEAVYDPNMPNGIFFENEGLSAISQLKVSSSGISSHSSGISIYPNPTNDVVWITGLKAYNEIELMNSTGSVLLLQTVTEQDKISLNLSSLSSGIYQIRLTGANSTIIKKIIKN